MSYKKYKNILNVTIILVFILNNTWCISNKTTEISLNLQGYYFSENFSHLMVKADEFLFLSELDKNQSVFFKEIMDSKEPKIPEISYVLVDKEGKFSASVIRNINGAESNILLHGKMLKCDKIPSQMQQFQEKHQIKLIIPEGKGINFLKALATPVTLTIKAGKTVLEYATATILAPVAIAFVLVVFIDAKMKGGH